MFDVRRGGRGPLLVVWQQRDSFSGEGQPPVPSSGHGLGRTRRQLMRWVRGSQSSCARAECACTCHRPWYSWRPKHQIWSATALIEGTRRDSLKTSLQRSLQSGRHA